MTKASGYLNDGGADPTMIQRARRLASQGYELPRIASVMGVDVPRVRLYLARSPRYQRCPTCRGMVLMPCRICELRAR